MSAPIPFRAAACVSAATTTSSTTTQIPGVSAGRSIRIANTSGVAGPTVWVKLGGSGVTATLDDIGIPANMTYVFDRDPTSETHVAHISTGASSVNICVGDGGC